MISLVNPHHDADLELDCSLEGATARDASAQILHDENLNASNSFDHPDRIVPRKHPVSAEGSRVQLDLPKLSIATVTVRLAP